MADIWNALLGAAVIFVSCYLGFELLTRFGTLKLFDGDSAKRWYHSPVAVIFTAAAILTWIVSRILNDGVLPYMFTDAVLLVFMVLLSVLDIRHKRIPNRMLLMLVGVWAFSLGVTIILKTELGIEVLFRSLAGSLFSGIVFLLCYLISRRQLGGGDVKLSFILGLYLTGSRITGALIYGILACCIYSVTQLVRKKIGVKDGVPLVPFLYLGVLIALILA